ncbi:MAG: hypothetical protein K0S22_2505 [Oscillospiraceae bacterium]|nr:hypothetical protein [Oscillospiraceae bacterium]
MKLLLQWRKRLVLFAALLLAAVYFFLDYIHFGCIFQRFLHIPCPGCGMTRAIKSVLVLDLVAAFLYHPMVFSLPLVAGYILMNGHLFKHKRFNDFILVLIGAGFLVNYVIKLAGLSG